MAESVQSTASFQGRDVKVAVAPETETETPVVSESPFTVVPSGVTAALTWAPGVPLERAVEEIVGFASASVVGVTTIGVALNVAV